MTEEQVSPIGELLFEHHMIYQQKLKRVVTQKEFADYIGIDDKLYNHLYKGRRTPKTTVRQLAEFFDDLRFYDAAEMPRPDPSLFYVQNNWDAVPNAIRKQISEIVSKYVGGDRK